jgi:N-acetylglutamate synthase-like GNAT family acetyltransferase
MPLPKLRVRRATLDDVSALTELWKTMMYPAEELARRITEFQVVESEHGKLAGAIGLSLAERQGLIHSEGFLDFAQADHARPLLWERLNSVATNHGLLRLWTQEKAPFWGHCGLASADEAALQKLPALWRQLPSGWLTLKLKDDLAEIISADKEFAVFMQAEKERTQRALQQAKALKFIATLLALALLVAVFVAAFLLLRKNPQLLHRGG